MHPLVVTIDIVSRILSVWRDKHLVEGEPVFCFPSSLIPVYRMVQPPAPHEPQWLPREKDAASLNGRLDNGVVWIQCGLMEMGNHANQVAWVENGKTLVICWDYSCQQVPALG